MPILSIKRQCGGVMIIAFFGHAAFGKSEMLKGKLLCLLKEYLKAEAVELYFGGYGGFDRFAYACATSLRGACPQTKFVFVTPYLSARVTEFYDEIVYPPLEGVPYKLAIVARNEWIAEKADLIIACVDHPWGGAYHACIRAQKKNKRIINLGEVSFDRL